MAFAICRTSKIKSLNSLTGSAKHTFRERPTINADESLTPKNLVVGVKNSNELKQSVIALLPEKRRSDAVICIEYLITASPEAFQRSGGWLDDRGRYEGSREGYFSKALNWLIERHGRDNVLSAAVHVDESTPHLVAYVVPLTTDGRLSCKDFLGGAKKMSAMQDDFYKQCAAECNLNRGVKWTNSKHESIKAFYGALSHDTPETSLSKTDYAAAALGIKTSAWKKERERMIALATANTLHMRTNKRMQARSHKMTRERGLLLSDKVNLEIKENKLREVEQELSQRLQSVEGREVNLQHELYELQVLRIENDRLISELSAAKVKLENIVSHPPRTPPRRSLEISNF